MTSVHRFLQANHRTLCLARARAKRAKFKMVDHGANRCRVADAAVGAAVSADRVHAPLGSSAIHRMHHKTNLPPAACAVSLDTDIRYMAILGGYKTWQGTRRTKRGVQ
jgi:hypothetical protein